MWEKKVSRIEKPNKREPIITKEEKNVAFKFIYFKLN